ncbi:hypothetical protein [Paractinoplanes brasiliensis]|uniref:Uncharacterized protein n=1 Tax=Paractinoplanes brasiliensis TaxID=52695 RepID=A0A4R6JY91_9ACTN|nr:hypothetical protein [Actinoplanes brasiliensis]MDY7089050.1 hypothetical protein [Actinomycetota bacterium]TDO40892.1 hypothetical protein C8E87_4612 [Actinoplanes brasiliensis]GID25960.1 hypothetical protein Abr02nite_09430 [Actinoplanes brasiliensis]
MTTYETLDLQSRVARYETALEELRSAHHDVRAVLQDQVLYERWQQIGADLGFVGGANGQQQDLQALNQQIPQMSESWAS